MCGVISGASKGGPAKTRMLSILPELRLACLEVPRLSKSPFCQEHERWRTRKTAVMAEDRPADDQGEGVDSAAGLTSDAFADLVRLLPAERALRRRS